MDPKKCSRLCTFKCQGTKLWSASELSSEPLKWQASEMSRARQPSCQVPFNSATKCQQPVYQVLCNHVKCQVTKHQVPDTSSQPSFQVPVYCQVPGNHVQLLPNIRQGGNKWLIAGKDISEPPIRDGVKTIKPRPVRQLLPLLYPVILAKVLI